MARRRRTLYPAPSDPVVLACISAVKAGDMAAAGALADRLEEINDPLASKVRRAVQAWQNSVEGYLSGRYTVRNKMTRWEEIALWHEWLRRRIREIWGRGWKWRRLSLKQLDTANAAMSVAAAE